MTDTPAGAGGQPPCPFGARLRELREKAGLTKSGLARAAGMNRAAVTRLERGIHEPDGPTVVKLAAVLGVRSDAFRVGSWNPPPPHAKPWRR